MSQRDLFGLLLLLQRFRFVCSDYHKLIRAPGTPPQAARSSCRATKQRTTPGEHSPSKRQEQYMLKKITMAAALAATLIAGNAAVANAEISGGGAPPGPTTERGLQSDYRHHGAAYAYAPRWQRHTTHAKRN
jgi:hypothetical protein